MNNVLIIGCGSIGANKPDEFDSPGTESILTHAHSVSVHPEFDLYGVMDVDYDKMMQACKKWNCPGLPGLPGFTAIPHGSDAVNVIVIATSTETHLDVVKEITKRKFPNLKLVIIEKPVGTSRQEAEKILALLDVPIVVNYTRRFLPEYKKLKEILDGIRVLSCVVNYVRGVKRDACHAINLINYFFGDILSVKFLSEGPDDYSKDDTSDCFWMKTEKCPNVVFIPGDGRIADHFDIEIMTSKGMYHIYNHGSSIYRRIVEKEKIYGDYKTLAGQIYDFPHIDFKRRLLMNLYDRVHDFIQGGENPCSIKEAIQVHRVIEKIRNE